MTCHSDPFAVILSEAKNLALPLRVNSAKNLLLPFASGRAVIALRIGLRTMALCNFLGCFAVMFPR
jgi:hypothetical protein